ncbi:unnamed protein product [Lactuca virosa]|uniref:MIP18 family-like domain-containing protein n=1 Tax=Lactuca virosa TaxID=75947 RepID=A0AAU9NHD2_9ASTR|nr:unnamed protein product [Lactuca virosa]
MANPRVKMKNAKIILGSSSMARRKILAEMGYDFTIMTADIDEKSIRKEKPEDLVVALAEAKADALISRLGIAGHKEENARPTLLITADTVVVYEGTIREKPSSKEEARHFVKGYSGGCAIVVGSVVVTNLTTGIKKRGWDRSEVYFHDIPDEAIDKLVDEGVTLNVAGGLMLEHPLTAPFVDTVIGTSDSVMGLSKSLTQKSINFVRDIRDPEHPYSLEQLSVLSEESITVDEKLGRILISFTPTIQHCSMATVIGLCLRVKLKDCFPPHFKVDIKVAPGSHADEAAVNKQLNDKERIVAAMENPNLRHLVDECLHSSEL